MRVPLHTWQMADTVTSYKGVKSHVKTIIVLSWTYAYQPVIVEPVEPPTMPATMPDPVIPSPSAPKVKKPRVVRPKPVKKSNFVYRPTQYWYPAQGISYA